MEVFVESILTNNQILFIDAPSEETFFSGHAFEVLKLTDSVGVQMCELITFSGWLLILNWVSFVVDLFDLHYVLKINLKFKLGD